MTTARSRLLPRALLAAVLALTSTIVSFAVTTSPAEAAPRAGAYAAALVTPLAAPRREILNGAVWRCAGDKCSAPADGSRAVTVCGHVARKFGPVARFTTPLGDLGAEELARCNGAG